MASPALDAFNASVDASSLSTNAKNTAKSWGATLYQGATQEEAAHIIRHLDEDIATASGEQLARLQALRLVVDGITTETSPHLATDVPAYLQPVGEAQMRWGKAMGYLLTSKSQAEASARWDQLAAQFPITAPISARLKALRDLITTKLGA